ncbi:MAG: divergent polysaccharide deacetylase family protein [Kiloniellales bacterium]
MGEGASPPPSDTQTAAVPRGPETTPLAPAPPAVPAWQRFARPFTAPPDRPLIAIVITGLGLNGPRTLQAIEQLPPEMSLSFSPYAKQTEEFMRTARAFGHEVLVDLPMEPATRDDPGAMALLTSLEPDANLDRLGLVLGRGRNYVGVVGTLGSRFVGDPNALEPVLNALVSRGLLYVDNRPVDTPHAAQKAAALGLPVAINDRSLDARMAATPAVDASLAQVERIARERGVAVALGQPNPTTLAFLVEWAKTLPGKGLALAPVSAVVNTQPIR